VGRLPAGAAPRPAVKGGDTAVAAAIPEKFRGRARRDAAAFYLSELAKGLLSGEIGVLSGQQQVTLATSEFMLLDIEVKQRKRGHRVQVTIQWPRRPLIRVPAAHGSRDG
jgi:amphi-Trp domain-containing protein